MFSVFLWLLYSFVDCGAILVHSHDYKLPVNYTYHNYNQLSLILKEIYYYFPEFATLYSIGKSSKKTNKFKEHSTAVGSARKMEKIGSVYNVQDQCQLFIRAITKFPLTVNHERDLWVLRIASPTSSVLGTPNIKFVGNIHGNEPVGREVILHLAQYLVKNYETDDEVKWFLDKTIVHLLPSLNPDGFEESNEGDCDSITGRGNGNLVDLNRSFPDFFKKNTLPQQPETHAVIEWLSKIPFVLSASFHGGSLVANYPYENDAETGEGSLVPRYSSSPDDDTFRYLAEVYSNNHLRMHKGSGCQDNESSFPGGITNGAAWYKITGGMQDYNYIQHGCMELTLEISCCKYPLAGNLENLWTENRKAILEFGKRANLGVRGMVMDSMTGTGLGNVTLNILGRDINFTSYKTGEFWRILLPGDYIIRAKARGYQVQQFPFTVRQTNQSFPEATWLNIYLQPLNVTEIKTSGSGLKSVSLCLYIFSLMIFSKCMDLHF